MEVTSLEDTVRSLEQKCTDAEQNNINLKKEMGQLRELEKAHVRKSKESCHKSTQTTFDSTCRGSDSVIGNDGKSFDLMLVSLPVSQFVIVSFRVIVTQSVCICKSASESCHQCVSCSVSQ